MCVSHLIRSNVELPCSNLDLVLGLTQKHWPCKQQLASTRTNRFITLICACYLNPHAWCTTSRWLRWSHLGHAMHACWAPRRTYLFSSTRHSLPHERMASTMHRTRHEVVVWFTACHEHPKARFAHARGLPPLAIVLSITLHQVQTPGAG